MLMKAKHRPTSSRTIREVHHWHSQIGIWVCWILLFLVCTGVPLHHADRFGLATATVEQHWLLDLYGIEEASRVFHYKAGEHSISQLDHRVYFQNQYLLANEQLLIGAVEIDGVIVIALANEIVLLTKEGELVERLTDLHGIPSNIQKIASLGDSILLQTESDLVQTDLDFAQWQKRSIESIKNWSKASPLDASLLQQLQSHYRASTLNWERILLDIHSGRLFGKFGPWFLDIAALILAILSITGIWMWSKKRR